MRPSLLALLAFVAGAAGGVASSCIVREAHADTGVTIVPVPVQGIVFRGVSGRAIARIREQATGGVVEVFDAHEQVVLRLRATRLGGAVDVGSEPPITQRPPRATGDEPGY